MDEVRRLKQLNRELSSSSGTQTAGVIKRRIAFDVGSGMTKVQLADVNISAKNGSGSIVRTLLEAEISVLFGGDWKASKNGCLSEAIMLEGLQAIKQLLEMAKAEAGEVDVEIAAVATEVFRKAKNGPEYLARVQEFGLPVQVVTQETEAELGFSTAMSSGKFLRTKVMSWDSGGGSFQITALRSSSSNGNFECYLGEFGSTVITSFLVQDLRRQVLDMKGFADGTTKVNPVSAAEAQAMIDHIKTHTPEVEPFSKNFMF